MATITTNTFLDDGTARTAGEVWTMNGATLTIRTDTRVHAGAPASMTGTLGNTTISSTLGGSVLIDARSVREVWFNGGSGTVPAIGATITQGGVSGYLLGVWADLTSAPTAAGGAMPAAGFIKFREVTGGAFAAGALTGITANATGPDVPSWIEVVQRQSATNTVPRLGSFVTRGTWHTLQQTTSGAAGQIIQLPTNGGGTGTHVPAVQIETSPGSGVYEWFTAVSSTYYLAANLGADARNKFVNTIGNGQLRIGNDGTTDCGYVPPAGCKIRLPNIFLRQVASSAADAVNLIPNATLATRPDFTTNAAGFLDFEYITADWYIIAGTAYKVLLKHSASFDSVNISSNASPFEIENYCSGVYTGTFNTLLVTGCAFGGAIKTGYCYRGSPSGNGVDVGTSNGDIYMEDMHTGLIGFAKTNGVYGLSCGAKRTTINGLQNLNSDISLSGKTVRLNNYDYCDKFKGNADIATVAFIARLTQCDDVIIDGITFGLNGTIPGYHNPASALIYAQNATNVKVRNLGTRSAPLQSASLALAPAQIFQDAGGCENITFQRVYADRLRTTFSTIASSSKNITFENVWTSNQTLQVPSANTMLKGIGMGSVSLGGVTAVYGSNYYDAFLSDTAGAIWFAMNEPTSFNSSNVTLTLTGGTGGFNAGGLVVLPNVGDNIVLEMSYFALGHTAFEKLSPKSISAQTSRLNYTYDINTGSGFSGVYKTLYKAKFRTAGGSSGTNTITVDDLGSDAPEIGDFLFTEPGNQVPANTTVTGVAGNVITVSANFTGSITSQVVYFVKELYDEVLDPAIGAKLRIKVAAMSANTANTVTGIQIPTASTLAAQTANLFPLDEPNTVTFTGLPVGCDVVVLEAGTSTIIAQADQIGGTTYAYEYRGVQSVDVGFIKPGYVPFYLRNLSLSTSDSSIPVSLTFDRNYS